MNYEELDEKHLWHPCSYLKDNAGYPPIRIVKGDGVWLETSDGRRILDAISSWWVNLFGHGNKYIAQKVSEQAQLLEHVIFVNYTHEPAIKLATKLSGLFNDELPRVFYAENGASAIEVAMKISFHYHQNIGQTQRTKFAYLADGYHGETIGALSLGSLGIYKDIYNPLLVQEVEVPSPHCYRCPYNLSRESCSAECFADTRRELDKHADTLSGVIVEPMVQGAGGMNIYSPVFLQKLREYTKQIGTHMICDEIAMGFGRTGKMMASHHANITPDIATVSKGLSGGFLPLSATLVRDEIYSAFKNCTDRAKSFMHSHSYGGNPIACAAGCAVFDIFEQSDVLGDINKKGKEIYAAVTDLQDHKNVGDVRNIGIITAIELVQDKKSKTQLDTTKRIGYQIYREAEKNGVLLRNLGDILYFMPPYVINDEEIDFMTRISKNAIVKILSQM